MAGTADLSTILNPPRGFRLQYGQGRVISWEAKTGHNTVEWAGTPIHDVSVLSDINALTIRSNDVVGMLGWTSPEGVSSWWVLGRIVDPGEGATDLIVHGNIAVAAGAGIAILDGGVLQANYPSGVTAVHFGGLLADGVYDGTGLLVQADGSGADIFRAKQDATGARQVYIGSSAGPVEAYRSAAVDSQHHAYGAMLFQSHDGANVELLSDGLLRLYGDDETRISCPGGPVNIVAPNGLFVTPITSGSTANARIESNGQITVISSSARYKTDIEDLPVDPATVLQLRPRSWMPGPVPRRCPPWMHETHSDEECHAGEAIAPPEDARRQVGFVAEELDDLGLGDFVEYDDEGRPDAIRYDRLTAALIPVLQQQQAQIEALTARLDALEQPEEGS